jgi:hypothetical protein
VIILHVDDMRIAAMPTVLKDLHDKLYHEFQITTSDSGRFLGMDVEYNVDNGILKMHMKTYIEATLQRFQNFDLSQGVPFREITGSLLWIVFCVMGTELLRVKDLARRSNDFDENDYKDALKVLSRIAERKDYGILYKRGGAGNEYVPANSRPVGRINADGSDVEKGRVNADVEKIIRRPGQYDFIRWADYTGICKPGEYDAELDAFVEIYHASTTSEIFSMGDEVEARQNELGESFLYKLDLLTDDPSLDIPKILAPTNKRFTVVAYSDASFAIGESMQSITGFVVMINGIPLLYGSLK